jgi:hypothetical protein
VEAFCAHQAEVFSWRIRVAIRWVKWSALIEPIELLAKEDCGNWISIGQPTPFFLNLTTYLGILEN